MITLFFLGFDTVSEIIFDNCSAFLDLKVKDEFGKSSFIHAVENRMEALVSKMLKSKYFYEQIDINTEIVKNNKKNLKKKYKKFKKN